MLSCSSTPYVSCSHLLDHSDLFHKQAGAFSGEASSRSGHGKVLTGTAPGDNIHRGQVSTIQLCDISDMDHAGKTQSCYRDGKRFDLTCPYRSDTMPHCCQWEATDSIEQTAHG